MEHLKGEIFLGLKKDEILLDMQDFDNKNILIEQKNKKSWSILKFI